MEDLDVDPEGAEGKNLMQELKKDKQDKQDKQDGSGKMDEEKK